MIEVKDLTKRYGEFLALKGVSFSIPKGEVVGLLGPNGAGKTTTMKILTTFLRPSSGKVTIGGFDVVGQADEVRRRIGYLPEHPPLYPELRVREYLRFAAQLRGIEKSKVERAIEQVLTSCVLTSVTNKLCGQLSRGYRQRVGLAQALIHEPDVIILDEPTSGLDPTQIVEIRKTIAGLKEKHTVILSTHILPEVAQTCSNVVIIANGRIVISGLLSELTSSRTLEERFLEAVSTDNLGAPE